MSADLYRSDIILDRLTALHPKLIDLSLERLERLLVKLGNPEDFLPPTMHVAGTNGKGSILAYLRAIFEAAGKQTHVYTSPHLVHFHERIRVAGQLISEDELTAQLEECEEANDGAPITFFEITTAVAFLAFSRKPAEVLLLETGLGGRLDATNVIRNPKITIIAPVSLDHRQFLGDDLASIAREKAGIIKPGVPLVLAKQEPEAATVILARANELQAAVFEEGRDWTVGCRAGHLVYESASGQYEFPLPNLVGAHQISNAGMAVAVMDKFQEIYLDNPAIGNGLRSADWPARLQNLTGGVVNGVLSQTTELWLDGGHNPAAGYMLANQAQTHWRDQPLYIIVGMMNSKDTLDFLRPLAAVVVSAWAVKIPGQINSLSALELADVARSVGFDAHPCLNIDSALREIQDLGSEPKRILICGSLYLAGTVLAADFYTSKLGLHKEDKGGAHDC